MEPAKTALESRLELDLKRNKAHQQAAQLIHELYKAGFIANQCMRDATWHLTELFYKHDVEFTTAEQRKLKELSL